MKIIAEKDLKDVSGGLLVIPPGISCGIAAVSSAVTYWQTTKSNSTFSGTVVSAVSGCAAGALAVIPGLATASLTTLVVGNAVAEKLSTSEKKDVSYWSDFSWDSSGGESSGTYSAGESGNW